MTPLTSAQKKYLRSQAHHLKPLVLVGKQGITDTLIRSVDTNLDTHELIKIRFNDHKDEKKKLTQEIVDRTQSDLAGLIGHVAIIYRPHKDPEKREITLP